MVKPRAMKWLEYGEDLYVRRLKKPDGYYIGESSVGDLDGPPFGTSDGTQAGASHLQ